MFQAAAATLTSSSRSIVSSPAQGFNGEVRAYILFAALSAFSQLRFPLLFYPMALAFLANARVSTARVAAFLSMSEISSVPDAEELDVPAGLLKISRGDFSWGEESKEGEGGAKECVLRDINLEAEAGELVAVVGRVGSGKSSLCSALLGEMETVGGKVRLSGKVAYAAQTPWVLNATIRENIVFGSEFDEKRYWKVVERCQLSHDLQILKDGDFTMIGERASAAACRGDRACLVLRVLCLTPLSRTSRALPGHQPERRAEAAHLRSASGVCEKRHRDSR